MDWDLSSALSDSLSMSAPSTMLSGSSSRIGSSIGSSVIAGSRGSRNAFTEDTLMEYIPDLDEVQEEDMTQTVAVAPEYKLQQITTLKELDEDLLQGKPFSTVDGVSLTKLCKGLVPERFLVENDDFWNWENIYTEVASEFRKSFKSQSQGTPSKKNEVPVLDIKEDS